MEFRTNILYYNGYDKKLFDSYEIYENVKSNIKKLKSYENPDLYIELEDKVIGIEQFEFSSYSSSKKGNKIKRKISEIDNNNYKDFINNENNKNNNYFITEVKTDTSKSNYENNFINTFEKHYERIEKYKENLKQFNKDIDIYFLICDETVEGTGIMIDGNYEFYVPTMNETILKHLKKRPNVNGLIFQCNCVYNKKLFYYLKNTSDNIEKLLKENKKYFNVELVQENFKRINSFWGFNENDE